MNTRALIRSATVTIALIAAATIAAELSASFKGLLSSIGNHHWVGKSVLSLVFFIVLQQVFARFTDKELSLKDTWWLTGSVVLSGLAILIFYVAHYAT